MPNLPVNTDDLIPHRYPIKMVDRIVSCNDKLKSSMLELAVDKESPFAAADGALDPECFLEIIAQAAAAQHGYNLQRNGEKEEKGFLVGSRNLIIHGKAYVEDKLSVQVECSTEIESLSAVSGTVFRNNQILASAMITVWHGQK